LQFVRVHAQSVPSIDIHNDLDATPLADSGIKDRLIKRHSLRYFVFCNFHTVYFPWQSATSLQNFIYHKRSNSWPHYLWGAISP